MIHVERCMIFRLNSCNKVIITCAQRVQFAPNERNQIGKEHFRTFQRVTSILSVNDFENLPKICFLACILVERLPGKHLERVRM